MPELEGSATERNLRSALDREAQDNRRFEYFARRAAVEGDTAAARAFRQVADGETAHAFGHLELLEAFEDPALGDVRNHLEAAVAAEKARGERYPAYASVAREEGLPDVAEWFDMVARAKRAHLASLKRALEELARPR